MPTLREITNQYRNSDHSASCSQQMQTLWSKIPGFTVCPHTLVSLPDDLQCSLDYRRWRSQRSLVLHSEFVRDREGPLLGSSGPRRVWGSRGKGMSAPWEHGPPYLRGKLPTARLHDPETEMEIMYKDPVCSDLPNTWEENVIRNQPVTMFTDKGSCVLWEFQLSGATRWRCRRQEWDGSSQQPPRGTGA